ncbi:hypothetical protein Dda3937_00024 [Dickeya dadantii 3937]|uniref:Uncharacterized protein n=1 Tax=Dickeya dadantii (strain 3937) TaxID=198628 RepID=E0SHS8_DICD3|nr:hypothetical protein Dda3937_00024 [Dickeya dadantii 3937]
MISFAVSGCSTISSVFWLSTISASSASWAWSSISKLFSKRALTSALIETSFSSAAALIFSFRSNGIFSDRLDISLISLPLWQEKISSYASILTKSILKQKININVMKTTKKYKKIILWM